MVRVIDVKDARTLIVDRAGVAGEVRLGDVVIPPGEETTAIEFLRTTLVQHYVMVESNARGEAYVYRSPDALFINGELLRRAYLISGRGWSSSASRHPARNARRATHRLAKRTACCRRRSRAPAGVGANSGFVSACRRVEWA
jgi:hypothetical protein